MGKSFRRDNERNRKFSNFRKSASKKYKNSNFRWDRGGLIDVNEESNQVDIYTK